MMKLYTYWRSSAAYRVRIAMHLKGIEFQPLPVHLVKQGGEQHLPDYVALNPNHLVPTLVDGDLVLNQSVAIVDYLEHKVAEPALYPDDVKEKALVQALALDIACEIHPINNLRVQQYLVNELSLSSEQKLAWVNDWITSGFKAVEAKIAQTAGKYCFGNSVTMADICLVPQVYNAVRFGIDMTAFPTISQVVEQCNKLPAFIAAQPENQDDAVLS